MNEIKDPRHQSYIDYNLVNILIVLIFKNLCNIKSMNEMSKEFNTTETIKKFWKYIGNGNLDEIPLKKKSVVDILQEEIFLDIVFIS